MSEVQLPRPKRQPRPPRTTHVRIYLNSHEKIEKMANDWDTSLQEALRYVIDLAEAGEIPKKLTP